jgi:hypothetical protein
VGRVTWTLAAALACSLLVNAMTIHRLGRRAPEPPAMPAARVVDAPAPAGREPSPVVDRTDAVLAELARLRREVAELRAGRPAELSAPPSPSAWEGDLARVLAEQDRWQSLWSDLDKLSGARRSGLIDEALHARGVVERTADFLGLAEPQRGAFIEAAREALRDVEKARAELEQAMRAEPRPPREESQAAFAAYRARQSAATERLSAQLDPSQPSQKQFSAQLAQWLRSATRDGFSRRAP